MPLPLRPDPILDRLIDVLAILVRHGRTTGQHDPVSHDPVRRREADEPEFSMTPYFLLMNSATRDSNSTTLLARDEPERILHLTHHGIDLGLVEHRPAVADVAARRRAG